MFPLLAACHGTTDPPPATDDPAPTDDATAATADTGTSAAHTGAPGHTAHTGESPPAAALESSPRPGLVDGPLDVELRSNDPTATVWYTVDGTWPDPAVATVATGPVHVAHDTLLRARAVGDLGEAELTGIWLFLEPDAASFSSNLPVLVLWSVDPAPVDKEEEYERFSLLVFEPDGTGRVSWPREADQWSMAGLKVHGSSTAGYPKKPYRLEAWAPDTGRIPGVQVDERLPLLGMPADGDWILGAPLDFDRARMRTSLAYEVSNAIGRYAPRTRFAEVFVAERGEDVGRDDYVGLYEVTEQIERSGDRVDVTELLPQDLAEPEVTGGWLFKEDRTGPNEHGFTAGTAGGRLAFQQPFVYVEPSEAEVAAPQAEWLSTYLDELGVALVSPGFTHPVTQHHYDDLIDTDAFIDHHIVNVWAKNPDALRLSAYYFKDREGLLAAGPVWDFDRTMGCASDDRASDPTWWDSTNETSDTTRMFDEAFYGGLFDDPAFRDRYFARMGDLLQNALAPVGVNLVIEGWAQEIDEGAARDFARWPQYPPRGGSLRSEVDRLEQWLRDRHDWMEGCLQLPDPMTCRGD